MNTIQIKKFKNRHIDHNGIVYVEPDLIFESIYNGHNDFANTIVINQDYQIDKFNEQSKIYGYDQIHYELDEIDHNNRINEWKIPIEYLEMNIEEWLIEKCDSDEERSRVCYELKLFKERNMIPVIKFMVYLVDVMRENNIVWGVGRGSSVSSYCLYLIGVHKIDSIKYELDIHEFLK